MRKSPKKFLTALVAVLLPSFLLRPVLRLLGHRVAASARIGFSLLWVDRICLDQHTRVGHLNLLVAKRLVLRERAYIGRQNVVLGPISIDLAPQGAIGNANKIVRGRQGSVTSGPSRLYLGRVAKITGGHRIDCTTSISIGDYSTIAGVGCQVWTHGYVHDTSGPGRYRIDGKVFIGDNVYIGAGCIISMGVRIGNGVIVGAGTTVARDLDEPGLYVSAAIRELPRPASPESRADLQQLADAGLCERVYRKIPKSQDQ